MWIWFRWKDWLDYKSCAPLQTPAFDDQLIGTGDGSTTTFQLKKIYGSAFDPWTRNITKPVSGTLTSGIDGVEKTITTDWTVDLTTGIITYNVAPGNALAVTAGFEFDTPVRFDTDTFLLGITNFNHGEIPDIPIRETREST